MKKAIVYLSIPFLLVPLILFLAKKKIMIADLLRYRREVPFSTVGIRYVCYCLLGKKEYRSIFAYRLGLNPILTKLVMLFTPPLDSIEILTAEIGDGMRIFHKLGCTINAERIGSHFTCAQGVTIGIGKQNEFGRTRPVIGESVWICANAIVIGGITIGNHSTIGAGAGAVVVHDVDECSIVAGNPARLIRKIDKETGQEEC